MSDRVVEGEVRYSMHRPNGSCARRDFWIPASAVVLTLLLCPGVYARQSPPRFEVATVKLSPPPSDPTGNININLGTFQNGRLTFGNVTLNDLLLFAYGLPSQEQLVGLDWTNSVRFDIEALAPPETPRDDLRPMVKQLLVDRLHVVTRWEERTVRYIALMPATGGPKLKPSSEAAVPATQLPGRIEHKRMPMSLLASLLSRFERQLVIDETGLTGVYEIKLEWTPDTVIPSPNLNAPPPERPGLYTAIQEQLGLRLEGRRGPLNVLVVVDASRTPESN